MNALQITDIDYVRSRLISQDANEVAQVTDEHYDKAIEQLIKTDIEFVSDSLFTSPYAAEHVGKFAANDKRFRSELHDIQRVIDLAAEIAENEEQARREQAEADEVAAAFED